MIIIIEGPDGSGKSTLAKNLSRTTGLPIVHMDKPDKYEDGDSMYTKYRSYLEQDVILDRCWISEAIYGPIMRGKSLLTEEHLHYLNAQLNSIPHMIIFCTGHIKTLWERCNRRGEDYIVDKSTYCKIWSEYIYMMESFKYIQHVVSY